MGAMEYKQFVLWDGFKLSCKNRYTDVCIAFHDFENKF